MKARRYAKWIDQDKEVPPCQLCGRHHVRRRCRNVKPVPSKDGLSMIQTPSHNGLYRGPARVRVIPPGVFGLSQKDGMTAWAREAGARGRLKRWGYYGIKESQRPKKEATP